MTEISTLTVGQRVVATSKARDESNRSDIYEFTIAEVTTYWIADRLDHRYGHGEWSFRLISPSVRDQIEALPLGTRFISHFSGGRTPALAWRLEGGCALYPGGKAGWSGLSEVDRIEVVPEER